MQSALGLTVPLESLSCAGFTNRKKKRLVVVKKKCEERPLKSLINPNRNALNCRKPGAIRALLIIGNFLHSSFRCLDRDKSHKKTKGKRLSPPTAKRGAKSRWPGKAAKSPRKTESYGELEPLPPVTRGVNGTVLPIFEPQKGGKRREHERKLK